MYSKVRFQLVDVSAWPTLLLKVVQRGSIAEEGAGLMALEEAMSAAFGQHVEVYLEPKADQNKPRAEVAEQVREWNERRKALKGQ